MRAWFPVIFAAIFCFSIPVGARSARAEEAGTELSEAPDLDSVLTLQPQEQQPPVGTAPSGRRSAPKSRKGGKSRDRSREKETDGTQARDRFETNTVVKSKYESGGQSLEVDPD